ncbi:MAG: transcription factor S [Thermoproteota archaeon]|nr:transcription factor S [Thermoproteota archaeon]
MKTKIEENIFTCPKCGLTSAKDSEPLGTVIAKGSGSSYQDKTLGGSSLKVMDSSKGPDALPTTAIDCPKCGNKNAFWWMLQTRSADEATTQFYRCTKCGHTWRNYS